VTCTLASPGSSGWSTPTRWPSRRSCSAPGRWPTGSAAAGFSRPAWSSSRPPRWRAHWRRASGSSTRRGPYRGLAGAAMFGTSLAIVSELAVACFLLLLFAVIEYRGRTPMLPLGLFAHRDFTAAQVTAFAVSAGFFGLYLYLTLYLQNVLGLAPLRTTTRSPGSSRFMADPFSRCVAGRLARRQTPRWRPRTGAALRDGRSGRCLQTSPAASGECRGGVPATTWAAR
jgi:hypothetical protein